MSTRPSKNQPPAGCECRQDHAVLAHPPATVVSLLYPLASILLAGRTVKDGVGAALEFLCRTFGWDAAGVWHDDAGQLEPLSEWNRHASGARSLAAWCQTPAFSAFNAPTVHHFPLASGSAGVTVLRDDATEHGLLAFYCRSHAGSGCLPHESVDLAAYQIARYLAARGHDVARARVLAGERRWEAAFRNSPIPSMITDAASGVCLSCNEEMEEFMARPRSAIVGCTALELGLWSAAVEQRKIARRLRAQGSVRQLELHCRLSHGDRWVLVNMEAVELDGRSCYLTQLVDITSRKHLEQQLRLTVAAVEHSGDALVIVSTRGIIASVNPAFTRITGYGTPQALGKSFDRLLHRPTGRYPADFFRNLTRNLRRDGHWEGEVWARRHDGQDIPILLSLSPILDDAGRITHFVCVFSDISRQKQYEAQLRAKALHDDLTGLANRTLLLEHGEKALQQARRNQGHVAVLFADLDLFKQVNDRHGHAVGDALLRQIADRLRHSVRQSDTVARIGGDEFVVLLCDSADDADLEAIARKLIDRLGKPFYVDGSRLQVGVSIGIARYPNDGDDMASLLETADNGLYKVKASGRNNFHLSG